MKSESPDFIESLSQQKARGLKISQGNFGKSIFPPFTATQASHDGITTLKASTALFPLQKEILRTQHKW